MGIGRTLCITRAHHNYTPPSHLTSQIIESILVWGDKKFIWSEVESDSWGFHLEKWSGKFLPSLLPENNPYSTIVWQPLTLLNWHCDGFGFTKGRIRGTNDEWDIQAQLSINLFQARSNASVRLYTCVTTRRWIVEPWENNSNAACTTSQGATNHRLVVTQV